MIISFYFETNNDNVDDVRMIKFYFKIPDKFISE